MNFDDNFAKNYARLNEKQKQAVDQIDGPVLVIAGPGTGKTQLLSTRIANILKKTDANPENILAMTFTESGAREMRERLATIIGARAASGVGIHTYHGFANQIYLSQREIFGDRQISDLEALAFREQVLASFSRNSYLNNGAPKQSKDIVALIHDLKRNDISAQELREISEKNSLFAKKINLKFATFDFSNLSSGSEETKIAAWADFANLFEVNSNVGKIPDLENVIGKELRKLVFDAEQQIRLDKEFRERDAKNKPVSPFKKLGAYKTKISEKDKENQFILNKSFSNSQLIEIAEFYEKYDLLKAKNSLYDYDDMIENAKKILVEIPEIRNTLAEKYQYILLDEFQDTNKSQLRLVELLTEEKINPNVMAVGDDDQGIMSFQGAEFSNMKDFADKFNVNKIISLTENYRSAEPIIEFAKNVIGGEKMADGQRDSDDGAGDRFVDDLRIREKFPELTKDLTAARSFDECEISRKLFRATSGEFSWITEKIAELFPNKTGYQNVAIIAPKHALLAEISRYFSAANIPVEYEASENILEDKNILDFLAVLRLVSALSNPEKSSDEIDFLWPEVLAERWWKIDPASVFKVSREAKKQRMEEKTIEWSEIIEKSDDTDLVEIGEKIQKISALTKNNSALEMINFTLGRKDLDTKNSRMPIIKTLAENDGEYLRFVGQLNTLAEKFAEYVPEKSEQNLDKFVEMTNAYIAAEIKIPDQNPYSAGENSVKLMTAHHSKGLQFKYVFMVSVDDSSWNSRGKSPSIALPENLKFIRTPNDENERIRLFFVAATRAEQFLYLTSSEKNFDGKKRTPLAFLDENWERNDDNYLVNSVSRKIPAQFAKIDDIASQNREIKPAELETRWQEFYAPAQIKPAELLHDRVKNFSISSHAITSYYDVKYDGPQEFYEKYILGFPSDNGANVNFGTVVHDIFDKLNKKPGDFTDEKGEMDLEKIIDLTHKMLTAKKISANDIENETSRARQSFANLIELRPELFAKNEDFQMLSEVNVSDSVFGQIKLSGRIDRIEIDDKNKIISVVDWKTGAIKLEDKFPVFSARSKKWVGSDKLWRYEIQMYFYKILLENSEMWQREYFANGYKFGKYRLEFIEGNLNPDAIPIVRDGEYADEKSARVGEMIKHLHSRVLGLDFPKVYGNSDVGVAEIEAFISNEIGEISE